MRRRLKLALTLTLSRKRERGNNVAFSHDIRTHFPLSRLRERVGVRARVHRRSDAKA